jgi:hypothetical protein
MPWVLRIAHVSTQRSSDSSSGSADSQEAMAHISRGLSAWKASLNRSLLPDDEAIQQLKSSGEGFTVGHSVEDLAWPVEPLRTTLLRGLAKLGVSRFAQKYPAVQVRKGSVNALLERCQTPHSTT